MWLLKNTEAGELVEQPGYMATLIAPHDSAVDDAIYKMGEHGVTFVFRLLMADHNCKYWH